MSGTIALLKSQYPTLTPEKIKTILQLSVDPVHIGELETGEMGAGRLNVARALSIADAFAELEESVDLPSAPADEVSGVYRDEEGKRTAPSSGETGISPVSGLEEPISSVQAGWFVRSPSFDTVYYIDTDFQRHPLWDSQTFFTWAESWDDIVWITDATLPTLKLASPLTPKPGVVLVKIQSDPGVYAIGGSALEPTLRFIPSEAVAEAVYGTMWADYIIDLDPSILRHFSVGSDVSEHEIVDTALMKTRDQIWDLING